MTLRGDYKIKKVPGVEPFSIAVGFNRRLGYLSCKDISPAGFIGLKPLNFVTLYPLVKANGNLPIFQSPPGRRTDSQLCEHNRHPCRSELP